jgi:demethoxyubiquinone hydroxylase (CLK1/Coq7/Cat5 family)
MKLDEAAHREHAEARGALPLPFPLPTVMRRVATLMTRGAYWL